MSPSLIFDSFLIICILFSIVSTLAESKNIVESQEKRFYYSGNSANFEAAEDHCKYVFGGKLANVQTQMDRDAIRKLLAGAMVSKLWVGGTPIKSDECQKPQYFTPCCWEWSDETPIGFEYWKLNTCWSIQEPMSRTVLVPGSYLLGFAQNMTLNQFICEASKSANFSAELYY